MSFDAQRRPSKLTQKIIWKRIRQSWIEKMVFVTNIYILYIPKEQMSFIKSDHVRRKFAGRFARVRAFALTFTKRKLPKLIQKQMRNVIKQIVFQRLAIQFIYRKSKQTVCCFTVRKNAELTFYISLLHKKYIVTCIIIKVISMIYLNTFLYTYLLLCFFFL
jgi:hypothetical protein